MLIVYMLRNEEGKWYKATRGGKQCGGWVEQDCATIWTTKQGPHAAKGHWLARWRRRHAGDDDPVLTVVEFQLCPAKISIIGDEGGDWEAIYINGELGHQTNRIETDVALDTLGITYYNGETDLGEGGSFPKQLKDVKTRG